jgi:hypothetical protein
MSDGKKLNIIFHFNKVNLIEMLIYVVSIVPLWVKNWKILLSVNSRTK